VCVFEHTANYFSPTLVFGARLTNWTQVTVVYRNGQPNLYLNGKFAHEGIKSEFVVHSGVGVPHRRGVAPFRGAQGDLAQFDRALTGPEVEAVFKSTPTPKLPAETPDIQIFRTGKHGYRAEVRRAGDYAARTAEGKTLEFRVPTLPEPFELPGPWAVRFPRGQGAPEHATFDQLASWSDNADPGIKYFSGTATYETRFELPRGQKVKGRRFYLNVGRVAVMAEITLNGKNLGTFWKPPFEMEVTEVIKSGQNLLQVKVTNLWPNRMIGDEQLAEDSKRKENGTLEEWPAWLLNGQPSPAGRYTFTTWRLWRKDGVLQQSGLLGPVVISCAQEVRFAP
jgi:hypothetical protein